MEAHFGEIEVWGEEAMERLGRALASCLRPGDFLGLYGGLGAGKTCLVRGLAQGLGTDDRLVASPSFTLINEYPGAIPLFHIDGYRLNRPEEVEELGLEEYWDGPGITVIEWAERIPHLPEDRLDIHISILGPESRKVCLLGLGTFSQRNELRKLLTLWR